MVRARDDRDDGAFSARKLWKVISGSHRFVERHLANGSRRRVGKTIVSSFATTQIHSMFDLFAAE